MMHSSSLQAGVFQVSYVTADLERAKSCLSSSHGISNFLTVDVIKDVIAENGQPAQLVMGVAHSFVGSTHVEIIEPRDGCVGIYDIVRGQLEAGAPLLFHHFGVLIDEGGWAEFRNRLGGTGRTIAVENIEGAAVPFCYTDDRSTFGHFMEYLSDGPPWRAFADQIPRS